MKIEWKTCFRVGVSVFLVYLCIKHWQPVADFVFSLLGASVPLIIGGAIAFLLNILMCFFERCYFPKSKKPIVLKTRRPVCVIVALLVLLAIISLVIGLVVPELTRAVILLFEKLPGAIDEFLVWVDVHELMPEQLLDYLDTINWQNVFNNMIGVLTSGIGNVMNFVIGTVSSVFSWIVSIFIGVIFAIYLLLSKETLMAQSERVMRRFLKEKWCEKIEYVLKVFNDCFRRYIVGQSIEAVILGVLCMIGMWILRLPYATMIGALVAFTALIPVAGAYIGGAVGAIMVLTESPVKALIFVAFLVILQQIEGNLIYPRVVGSSMGLPGIWVLAAVTVGGGVAGILGMLLGVPIAAALYRMLRHDMRKQALKAAEAASKAEGASGQTETEPPADEETAQEPPSQKTKPAHKKKKTKGGQ